MESLDADLRDAIELAQRNIKMEGRATPVAAYRKMLRQRTATLNLFAGRWTN